MQYYTTKDVIEKHHFTPDFLYKCLKRLNRIFQGHITRGNNNARLFSSEAMNIFDIIAQRKQDGQSITEIEDFLLQGHQPVTTENERDIEPVVTADATVLTDIIHLVKQHRQELKQELEKQIRLVEVIKDMQRENLTLKNSMKLLTDGRNPEQVRQEWFEQQKREIQTFLKVRELQSAGFMQWRKRRKILRELAGLLEPR